MDNQTIIKLIEEDFEDYVKVRDASLDDHNIVSAKLMEAKLSAVARLWMKVQQQIEKEKGQT